MPTTSAATRAQRHTTCRHCAQAIRAQAPYRRGTWADALGQCACWGKDGQTPTMHAPAAPQRRPGPPAQAPAQNGPPAPPADPTPPPDRWAGSTALLAAFPAARPMWQHDPGRAWPWTLECFMVGKALVIVQNFTSGNGWTAYLEVAGNRIDGTFDAIADAGGLTGWQR